MVLLAAQYLCSYSLASEALCEAETTTCVQQVIGCRPRKTKYLRGSEHNRIRMQSGNCKSPGKNGCQEPLCASLQIVQATSDMLDGTLWDAFGRVQVQSPPNLAVEVPRMCFISGLTGEELMMLVDAFGKSSERFSCFLS